MERESPARKTPARERTYGLAKILGLITFTSMALAAMVQFGSVTAFVWLVVMFVLLAYLALRQTSCQRSTTEERHGARTAIGADNNARPESTGQWRSN